jgi:hypothetical protein
MSKIKATIQVEDIGCTLELSIDMASNAEFVAQFDTFGEAAEQAVIDMAEELGASLRAQYDKRDAVTKRVKELGS